MAQAQARDFLQRRSRRLELRRQLDVLLCLGPIVLGSTHGTFFFREPGGLKSSQKTPKSQPKDTLNRSTKVPKAFKNTKQSNGRGLTQQTLEGRQNGPATSREGLQDLSPLLHHLPGVAEHVHRSFHLSASGVYGPLQTIKRHNDPECKYVQQRCH